MLTVYSEPENDQHHRPPVRQRCCWYRDRRLVSFVQTPSRVVSHRPPGKQGSDAIPPPLPSLSFLPSRGHALAGHTAPFGDTFSFVFSFFLVPFSFWQLLSSLIIIQHTKKETGRRCRLGCRRRGEEHFAGPVFWGHQSPNRQSVGQDSSLFLLFHFETISLSTMRMLWSQ